MYGVPIGTDTFVNNCLERRVDEILEDANRASVVLASERQCLWTMLRSSILARYWLMLVHPSQVEVAARRVDMVIWGVLEKVAGFYSSRRC